MTRLSNIAYSLLFLFAAGSVSANSVRVDKQPGALRGEVVLVTSQGERSVAVNAWNAWLAEGGKSVLWSGPDGSGGYENEGQSLWRYDIATGQRRKLLAEDYVITKAVAVIGNSGKTAILVSMTDGGLGAPHVAVVDPTRGQVWRQVGASFHDFRKGKIAVGVYNLQNFETRDASKARPVRTLFLDIDDLLSRPVIRQVARQDVDAAIVGTVFIPQDAILPDGALLKLALADVSRADAPSVVIATRSVEVKGTRQVPFLLPYDPGRIVSNHSYSMQARIEDSGRLLYISPDANPVITQGNPIAVEITLQRAQPQ